MFARVKYFTGESRTPFRNFKTIAPTCAVVFSAISVIALSLTSSVLASEHSFQDWRLTCPEDGRECALSTTSFAEDRTWLSTIRMQPRFDGATLPVQILVPPQVHLASGLFVNIPGLGEKQATFLRCTVQACDARLTLADDDLLAWKQARAAEVLYRPSVSGPPIRYGVSLMGLTAAMDAMAGVTQ